MSVKRETLTAAVGREMPPDQLPSQIVEYCRQLCRLATEHRALNERNIAGGLSVVEHRRMIRTRNAIAAWMQVYDFRPAWHYNQQMLVIEFPSGKPGVIVPAAPPKGERQWR